MNIYKDLLDVEIDLSKYEEDIFEWVRSNNAPEEVFSEDGLEAWAISNGYTKEV